MVLQIDKVLSIGFPISDFIDWLDRVSVVEKILPFPQSSLSNLQFVPRCCEWFQTQGPNSRNLMMEGGGGGVQQRFILYTQKNHNFRICLPKKSLLFLAYPKKSRSPFFAIQKNPGIFHMPQKNHFWPKSQTPKKKM